MENLSMKDLLESQERELDAIKIGEVVKAKISKITKDEVILEMNFGFDGIIKKEELNLEKSKNIDEVYNVGDEIEGIITRVNQKDATINLSKLKFDVVKGYESIVSAFEDKKIITVLTHKAIERGVFAIYNNVEIFIPISKLSTKFVDKTSGFVNKNLEVYIIELDKNKNKIVASHRDVLKEREDKERLERKAREKEEKEERLREQKEQKEERIAKIKKEKEALFDSLEVGQKKDAKVKKIVEYGAFVDIGGIEGLLHKNNLSWEKFENIENLISLDQEIEVYILDIDKEKRKFAVALKDINNDPWMNSNIYEGDVISGEVVRVIEKGAFVKIATAVEAFLPISHISEEGVSKITKHINVGDTIKAMVIDFRPKNRKLVVSIKEATREPEEDISEYLEVEDSLGSLGELFKNKFKNLK